MKSQVHVKWEVKPQTTLSLLQLIDSNDRYRQAFFPQGITVLKGKYKIAAEVCVEFFQNDLWLDDARRRGLVQKNQHGDWVRDETKWISTTSNPVTLRIKELKHRIEENWYQEKHGINPEWRSWGEIPSPRETFKEEHPYYIMLRHLCNYDVVPPSASPPDLRRRRRSSTPIGSPLRGITPTPQSDKVPTKRLRYANSSKIDHNNDEIAEELRPTQMQGQDVAAGLDSDNESDGDFDNFMFRDLCNIPDLDPGIHASHNGEPNIQANPPSVQLSGQERVLMLKDREVGKGNEFVPGLTIDTAIELLDEGDSDVDAVDKNILPVRSEIEIIAVNKHQPERHEPPSPSKKQQRTTRDSPPMITDNLILDWKVLQSVPTARLLMMIGSSKSNPEMLYPLPHGWACLSWAQRRLARCEILLEALTRLHAVFPIKWNAIGTYRLLVNTSYMSLSLNRGVLQLAESLGFVIQRSEVDVRIEKDPTVMRMFASGKEAQSNVKKGWCNMDFLSSVKSTFNSQLEALVRGLHDRLAMSNWCRRHEFKLCIDEGERYRGTTALRKLFETTTMLDSCERNHSHAAGTPDRLRIHVTSNAIRGALEGPMAPWQGEALVMSPMQFVEYMKDYIKSVPGRRQV